MADPEDDDEIDFTPEIDFQADEPSKELDKNTFVGPKQEGITNRLSSDIISRAHSFASDHPTITTGLSELIFGPNAVRQPDQPEVMPDIGAKIPGVTALTDKAVNAISPNHPILGIGARVLGDTIASGPDMRTAGIKSSPKLNPELVNQNLASDLGKLKIPEEPNLKEAIGPTAKLNRPVEIENGTAKLRTLPSPEEVKQNYEALDFKPDESEIFPEVDSKLKSLYTDDKPLSRNILKGEEGVLKIKGFKKNEVDDIRESLVNRLVRGYVQPSELYKDYSKLSKSQFEKILDDIINNGDIEKARKSIRTESQPLAPAASELANNMIEKIKEHVAARGAQDDLVTAERSRRFKNVDKITTQGEAGLPAKLAELKGKYPKVPVDTFKEAIDQPSVDAIHNMINDLPDMSTPEKLRARIAFSKVVGNWSTDQALQPNEIKTLQKIFGSKTADELVELHGGLGLTELPKGLFSLKTLEDIGNFTKTTRLGADIGWPLRQGKFYAGRKPWVEALGPSIRSYLSKAYATGRLDDLRLDPDYERAVEGGLNLSEFGVVRDSAAKEEWAPSNFYDRLEEKGKIGKVIATPFTGSERAQTVGTDLLRMGIYKQLRAAYKNLYGSTVKNAMGDEAKLKEAEYLNPDNPYLNKKIADEINTKTGRGRLPKLMEPAGRGLNAISYPRMISSNIRSLNRIFNPIKSVDGSLKIRYMEMDPIERKETLKQLLSAGSIVGISLGLHHLRGASTTDNPTDTQFLRSKFGNTMVDTSGGIDPLLIAAARVATGAQTNSKGKVQSLGGYGIRTGSQVAEDVILNNRLSPLADLAKTIVDRQEFGGRVIHKSDIPRVVLQHTLEPMLAEDLYGLAKDNPDLLNGLLAGVEDIMGGSVTTNQLVTSSERKHPKLVLKRWPSENFGLTLPVEQ